RLHALPHDNPPPAVKMECPAYSVSNAKLDQLEGFRSGCGRGDRQAVAERPASSPQRTNRFTNDSGKRLLGARVALLLREAPQGLLEILDANRRLLVPPGFFQRFRRLLILAFEDQLPGRLEDQVPARA